MIILQANDISRRFNGVTFFEHFSFQIQDHSRIGLVGRNGAGKSTLLKILIGQELPDEGVVSSKKGLKISYLAQNTGINSILSIYEEMLTSFQKVQELEKKMHQKEKDIATSIDYNSKNYKNMLEEYDRIQQEFEELNGYGYEAVIRSVLHGFGFEESSYSQKISTLSGGQKTRLAIAKQLLEKPDLLVLDEPTNHLDMKTLSWLEKYLQNYKGALLIVSHDRYFLDSIVNEIYEVHEGLLDHYQGNYSQYIEQKIVKINAEQKAFDRQQMEISKLEDFINRNIVRASTTKRAQSRRKKLEKMEKIVAPKNESKVARISFTTAHNSGNEVLQVKKLNIGYQYNHPLAKNINLFVKKQHSVALVGLNGVGKSTFIKTLLGKISPLSGSFKLGSNVTVGYYDQEQATLNPKKTVLNSVWDLYPRLSEREVRSILGSFMFMGEEVNKKVVALSGGEKARLLLTILSMNKDNFLILDEPTNHLDIDSREILEIALNEYNGTILFVSHDRYFINKVATEVVELSKEGLEFFDGDYDYYLEKKAGIFEDNKIKIDNESRSSKLEYQITREQQKKIRKKERDITNFEIMIEDINKEIEILEEKLNDPLNGEDLPKLIELTNQIELLNKDLNKIEEDWTQASIELEAFQKNEKG